MTSTLTTDNQANQSTGGDHFDHLLPVGYQYEKKNLGER